MRFILVQISTFSYEYIRTNNAVNNHDAPKTKPAPAIGITYVVPLSSKGVIRNVTSFFGYNRKSNY